MIIKSYEVPSNSHYLLVKSHSYWKWPLKSLIYPFKMVMFQSLFVCLPEGKSHETAIQSDETAIESHKTAIESHKTAIKSHKTAIKSHKTAIKPANLLALYETPTGWSTVASPCVSPRSPTTSRSSWATARWRAAFWWQLRRRCRIWRTTPKNGGNPENRDLIWVNGTWYILIWT